MNTEMMAPPIQENHNEMLERLGFGPDPRFDDYKLDLEINGKEFHINRAGLETYRQGFNRDLAKNSKLAGSVYMAAQQVAFAMETMGTKEEPVTGEQPGKVPHQFPGVALEVKNAAGEEDVRKIEKDGKLVPLDTLFDGNDTTSETLTNVELVCNALPTEEDKRAYLDLYKDKIVIMTDYLFKHIQDRNGEGPLFWEFPPEGADKYALRVTYWKDSVYPDPTKDEPTYPVAYALSHIMAARALKSVATLFEGDSDESYAQLARNCADLSDEMFRKGIEHFFRKDDFVVAQDADGKVTGPFSDELHALAYIPVEYADLLPFEEMVKRAEKLYTPVGIACANQDIGKHKSHDPYHMDESVWLMDNGVIYAGITKFMLARPELRPLLQGPRDVTERVLVAPELVKQTANGPMTEEEVERTARELMATSSYDLDMIISQELYSAKREKIPEGVPVAEENRKMQILPSGNAHQLWSIPVARLMMTNAADSFYLDL